MSGRRVTERRAVAHRLAIVTSAATLVLIVFGGLVTNTGSALAVPDWPTTFGHNMFLYPWSGMVGGVFYEHGHRLIGALVGLLTVGVAAATWRRGPRLRALGLVAVTLVVVQGVLGGLRVVLLKETLAIVHGCLAPAFLALVVAIAFLTSRAAASRPEGIDASLRAPTLAAAGLLYAQVVFGALLTHAGWIDLHLVGAAVVFVFVPIATARLRRTGDPVAMPVARALLILLAVQLVLGLGAFLARFSSAGIPGEQAALLILPVAHRLVGGLLVAAAVVAAIRVTSSGAHAREAAMSAPFAAGLSR